MTSCRWNRVLRIENGVSIKRKVFWLLLFDLWLRNSFSLATTLWSCYYLALLMIMIDLIHISSCFINLLELLLKEYSFATFSPLVWFTCIWIEHVSRALANDMLLWRLSNMQHLHTARERADLRDIKSSGFLFKCGCFSSLTL